MQTTLQGVFPALVTPLTADDHADHDTLAGFIDYLIGECGVHGVIPLGSTGEFYALSRVEREAVLRTTLDAAGGRVPVVAGTNAGSTADVVRYAGQAEQMGAAGVLLAAPYYSLPTQEAVREVLREQGDSLIVIRSEDILKIHIHTDEPEEVFSWLRGVGELVTHKADRPRTEGGRPFSFLTPATGRRLLMPKTHDPA